MIYLILAFELKLNFNKGHLENTRNCARDVQ